MILANIWLALALGSVRAPTPVLVAAAADLRYAMDSLVSVYTKAHPDAQIKVVYGSSGNFYQQILNGGPFDLFFSADMEYVQHLKDAGKLSGEVKRYGTGHLVLWSLTRDPSVKKMDLLKEPTVFKIAIANPDHAPYGKRAVESLQYYHLYDQVSGKLVRGENISQAANYAATGSTDVGLIALSLALSPLMVKTGGHYWLVPDESHGRLDQGYALLPHGQDNTDAVGFTAFIASDEARSILHRFGFQ